MADTDPVIETLARMRETASAPKPRLYTEAEAMALVAAALKGAASKFDPATTMARRGIQETILSMIPVDAAAALDEVRRAARRVKPLVWVDAPEGCGFKWQAYCGLMSGYYYASSEGQKREHEAVRAARILAALEEPK